MAAGAAGDQGPLGLARAAPWWVPAYGAAAGLAALYGLGARTGRRAVALAAAAIGTGVCAFFRDPQREPGTGVLLAPADGVISGIERRPDGRVRIATYMRLRDVHVNRAPIDGVVRELRHRPGRHRLAMRKDSDVNERLEWTIDTALGDLELIQLAGMAARRIVSYRRPGEPVERGQRIGMIRFGMVHGYPARERAMAVAIWSATAAVAAGAGPSIGGALVDIDNWRLVFLVNLPVGVAAWWLAGRQLVESRAPGRRAPPDLLGALVLAGAVGVLSLTIVQGQSWGWTSFGVVAGIGGTAIAGAFVGARSPLPARGGSARGRYRLGLSARQRCRSGRCATRAVRRGDRLQRRHPTGRRDARRRDPGGAARPSGESRRGARVPRQLGVRRRVLWLRGVWGADVAVLTYRQRRAAN